MKHPYEDAPNYRFWRRVVSGRPLEDLDLLPHQVMQITRDQPIMTAGSCFAQHIGRNLVNAGYELMITELGHPVLDQETRTAFGYGIFTARYGNVYTSRQLVQLFDRVYGRFQPKDDVWPAKDGGFYDPFRPTIQPGGFDTLALYETDRAKHFSAVREGFEGCEIFVFTLGLTEAWLSREDGAAYPICPGVAAGEFDPERHAFHNLTAEEVIADMTSFIERLRSVNFGVKVILTVSPVPLMATAEDEHVLVATTYSKAVLRVAAETLRRTLPEVYYFPSYEMITSVHSKSAYYAEDFRTVLPEGVRRVMNTFFRAYTDRATSERPAAPRGLARARADRRIFHARAEGLAKALCDEELLDPDA